MAAAFSATAQLDLRAVHEDRIDVRELAESATSFGSYCLRWQRIGWSGIGNTVGTPDAAFIKTAQRLSAIA